MKVLKLYVDGLIDLVAVTLLVVFVDIMLAIAVVDATAMAGVILTKSNE
jgi:hypothetical protein